jgi:hypothetical protein
VDNPASQQLKPQLIHLSPPWGVFKRAEPALMLVGGIYYRVQVAHMKLCASRAFWLVAYPSQGHEMLFDAHTRSC